MDKGERACRELLAKNIKHLRRHYGFSQLDLALELNVSVNFISGIELGKKWVSPATLAKLAQVLRVEVYELFKPEPAAVKVDVSAELAKYLDAVDSTLARHIAHSIEPAIERSITRTVAKMRSHYKQQLEHG